MNTRPPTEQEFRRWVTYKTRFIGKTKPMVQALVVFGEIANAAQNEIERITGQRPNIVTEQQAQRINEIGRRASILDNQITGVLLQKYGVAIDDDGTLNIVAAAAPEGDIYPRDEMALGIAPIIIAVGIAAVTLLIAGDQAEDRLEKQAQIEATRLQQKMLAADLEMMKQPSEKRTQWEQWKKQAATRAKEAAKAIPGSTGWIQKFLGNKGTSILVAGVIGIAAAYFLIPKLRRN